MVNLFTLSIFNLIGFLLFSNLTKEKEFSNVSILILVLSFFVMKSL